MRKIVFLIISSIFLAGNAHGHGPSADSTKERVKFWVNPNTYNYVQCSAQGQILTFGCSSSGPGYDWYISDPLFPGLLQTFYGCSGIGNETMIISDEFEDNSDLVSFYLKDLSPTIFVDWIPRVNVTGKWKPNNNSGGNLPDYSGGTTFTAQDVDTLIFTANSNYTGNDYRWKIQAENGPSFFLTLTGKTIKFWQANLKGLIQGIGDDYELYFGRGKKWFVWAYGPENKNEHISWAEFGSPDQVKRGRSENAIGWISFYEYPLILRDGNNERIDPGHDICTDNISLQVQGWSGGQIKWEILQNGSEIDSWTSNGAITNYNISDLPKYNKSLYIQIRAKGVTSGSYLFQAKNYYWIGETPVLTISTTKSCANKDNGTFTVSRSSHLSYPITMTLYHNDIGDTSAIATYQNIYAQFQVPDPLGPGNYRIKYIFQVDPDKRTCLKTETFVIEAYEDPTLTIIYSLSPTCRGRSDGKIDTNSTCHPGNGPLLKVYDRYGGKNNYLNLNQLKPDRYTLVGIDNKGCESDSIPVTVPETDSISFSLDSSKPPLCYGESNGKIILSNIKGGPGRPNISVTDKYYINYVNTAHDASCSSIGRPCLGHNFNGIDTFAVYISRTLMNTAECFSGTQYITLGQPAELLPQLTKSSFGNGEFNLDCNGGTNGSIVVSVPARQDELHYFIDPAEGTLLDSTFHDLPAGDYQVRVEDHTADAICYSDTFPVTLTEPGPIVLTDTTIVPETCPGTEDARISVAASSPVSGCSFEWSYQSNTSGSLEDLPSGTYLLTVTDEICITGRIFVFPVGSIPLLTVDYETSMPLCRNSSDGNITITGIHNNTGPDTWYSFGNNHEILLNSFPLDLGSLSSGTYPFAVYDSRYIQTSFEGCKTIIDLTIDQKNAVQIVPKFTFPHCYGGTGSITLTNITGPGDTASYSYTWYDAEGLAIAHSKNLINVPAGLYTLSVFDEDGCESVFEDLLLYQPPALQINSVDHTDASCAEAHNGSLSINAEGGTGDLRYSIGNNSYSFGNLFTGLAPGSYTVSVTDAYGCLAETQVELGAGELLLDLAGIKPVTCFGDRDGYLYLSASGGNGIYNYFAVSSDSLLTNNYGIFNRLGTGSYRLSAADPATGCLSDTLTAEITEPDSITIGITLVDSASCGQYSGQVSHSVSGGNDGYTVRWEREFLGIVTDLSALHSGNYIVKVTDSKNCRSSQHFYLPERSAPVITGYEIPDSAWCGLPLGRVNVHVEGGSPAYQYSWSHNASLNSPLASNLVSGDYSLTVTDQHQCSDELDFTLNDGPALIMQSSSVSATCNTADGNATLIVSGGKAPYVYQWPVEVSSVPVSNPLMTGLTAGIYEVFIRDAAGCVDSIDVTVSDHSSLNITINQLTGAWCDLPTGTMTATTTGGGDPLYYFLRKEGDPTVFSNSLSAANLLQGNYILQVMTTAECSKYKKFTIGDSLELRPQLSLLTADSSSCKQATGNIATTLSQGLAPFTYTWSNGFTGNTGILSNIPSGEYRVTLTDARGCIDSLETEVFDKNAPLLQILGSEDAYCGTPTGSFLLKAMQGIMPYLGSLEQKPEKTYPFIYTDSLNAYATRIDSLLPSNDLYSMWAVDGYGCESNTILYYIDDFNPLQLNIIDIDPVRCHGGSDGKALALAEQGAGPYHYIWSGNPVDSALNTGLPGGPFGVTATDAAGCSRSETTFSIPEPLAIRLTNSNSVDPLCHNSCNGSIYVTAAGGTGPLGFVWNQTDTAAAGNNLCSGNNLLEITDANGCQSQTLFVLDNPPVLSSPSLPESLTICTGQDFVLDPGDEWQEYSWTSDNGFSSQERIIPISQPGNYYLNARSGEGCAVLDTFTLMVSESLLSAEFLMASEANTGDTIVIIEVSWPPAEQFSWSFPDGSEMCLDNDYHKEIVFDTPGTYYIELTASLATCVSVKGKYIEILETSPGKSAEEFKPYGRLIRSFDIYPNPAGEDLTIRIRLSGKSDLRVDVLSIDGRLVDNSLIASGLDNYTLSLDVSQLMPGMYLVRLVTRSQAETKILIVR